MKHIALSLAMAVAGTLSVAPYAVYAQDETRAQDNSFEPGQEVSFQFFYDSLGTDMGEWVETEEYGYVFLPKVTDAKWAPYTVGHWVDSDDGWTWVSEEPWAKR